MRTKSVTEKVKELYNQQPYQAYNEDYFPVFKSLGLNREDLAKFFFGKNILEIGSGGGQLSLFMSGLGGTVTGVDISQESLRRAEAQAKILNRINNRWILGDIFDDNFLQAHELKYDFVLCYGVLHHTANPALGFARLTRLLKPGGIVLAGVYSRTQWLYRLKRKIVILLAKDNGEKRQYWAEKLFFRKSQNRVAVFDGYVHPQVSFHSIFEVLNWGVSQKLSYLGSWPPIEVSYYFKQIFKFNFLKAFDNSRIGYYLTEVFWFLRGKSVMVSMVFKNTKQ